MPLTRGDAIGYDADRMSYKFTMMNGVRTVLCEISSVALSDLDGSRWTAKIGDREAQFVGLRETIETIASELFDAGHGQTQIIRIFGKHVDRRQF